MLSIADTCVQEILNSINTQIENTNPPIRPTKVEGCIEKAKAKFGENNKVNTILCGGRELKRLSLDPNVVQPEEELKVSNCQVTLKHAMDTVKFFMDKKHKKVKNVILQIGSNHIEKGHTEILTNDVMDFASDLVQQGVNLIIS